MAPASPPFSSPPPPFVGCKTAAFSWPNDGDVIGWPNEAPPKLKTGLDAPADDDDDDISNPLTVGAAAVAGLALAPLPKEKPPAGLALLPNEKPPAGGGAALALLVGEPKPVWKRERGENI